jgi:serine/threonine protein kinase
MTGDGQNLDHNTVALTTGGKSKRLLNTGDIIGGSYRLKGLLGQGGMGYVFRAEHLMIGQDYALKMLASDQINEVIWSRFQAEGKVIAKLDHPNIVKIYNMGVDQGECPYYVMDLLDGVALSDCIKDKMPFTIDEILNLFIQIASGLGYAHSHGIIHRDVKPSNVVLVDSGGQYPTAKIVDFGIAKLVGAADLPTQSLTATGEIFGSPYYMSPEQCLGSAIDHRSDIYSLGCTLFEVLCGQPPFIGESAVQTVMMHQNKPSPTLESVNGKFSSGEMEDLVAKMLMKRPADRYQSMEQVVHDLNRVWDHKGVGKNVETGFITSVDSQLEEMSSKYTGGEKYRTLRKLTSIAGGFLLLGLAAFVCFRILKITLPDVRPPLRTHNDDQISEKNIASVLVVDKDLARISKQLEGVKSITSSIDKKDGSRVFNCPNFHVGTFAWFKGMKDFAGRDFDTTDDGRVDACDDAHVPAGEPIFLLLNPALNRDTWLYPQILTRFGPDELIGLDVESFVPTLDLVSKTEDDATTHCVDRVVKAISPWTDLRFFKLHNLPLSDQALIELDKHKTLKRFRASGTGLNVNVLAGRQFLRHLKIFEIDKTPDVESVLCALKGSTAIEEVSLAHTTVLAQGLKALASCPNLKVLDLQDCQLDSGALEAISSIRTLKHLVMYKCDLQADQAPALAKLRYIKRVGLDLSKFPPEKSRSF